MNQRIFILALLAVSASGCPVDPEAESSDPAGPIDGSDPSGTKGACLESMGSPIRCTEALPNGSTQWDDLRWSCEHEDDSYHQYTWVEECPAGITSGCASRDGFSGVEVNEWVYGGARCLRSGDELDPPEGLGVDDVEPVEPMGYPQSTDTRPAEECTPDPMCLGNPSHIEDTTTIVAPVSPWLDPKFICTEGQMWQGLDIEGEWSLDGQGGRFCQYGAERLSGSRIRFSHWPFASALADGSGLIIRLQGYNDLTPGEVGQVDVDIERSTSRDKTPFKWLAEDCEITIDGFEQTEESIVDPDGFTSSLWAVTGDVVCSSPLPVEAFAHERASMGYVSVEADDLMLNEMSFRALVP